MSTTRIVIVGGGYAGCMAANRLARKTDPETAAITLINARPDFIERVRLHQRVAGTGEAGTPLTEMLNDRVSLRIGAAASIGDGVVTLDDGTEIAFDRLVYAAGGAPRGPEGTLAVGDPEQATTARARLAALGDGAHVTVVGGGLTGIETATEIAEARPELAVTLVSAGEVGASLHPSARRRIHDELAALGVAERRGIYDPAQRSDLTLWAIATDVSGLAQRSGLRVDADGRLTVDRYLRSVTDPRIFGAGDAAAVPGQRLSCQTAMPQGAHAADNLLRELKHAPLRPYSMGYAGQNVSIGRRRAVIQAARRDDTPIRLWFGGRAGALFKEQVCAMAKAAAGSGHYTWLPAPRSARTPATETPSPETTSGRTPTGR
ncbi:FAD-dependent oxidoreductase [Gordonia sp. (in: high G+C Gram-positive bacteria)]|uniref:NAD(P)/FAD-dependent oxidoreductase n=1 Tax=Gordonia sp. (in: high G+C Gram-positive bacteria) TaxID=84139 RepID=UPI00261D6B06|nr:FAD-dependent oxidoreductase [Gordonia sp. (in: high G+C Gram-positive bacteria)]